MGETDTLEIGAPPSRFRKGMAAIIEEAARAIAMEHGGDCEQKDEPEAWTLDQDSYNAGYYDGLAKCEGNGISVQQLETLLRAQCKRFGITEFLSLAKAACHMESAIQTCQFSDERNPFDLESEAGNGG